MLLAGDIELNPGPQSTPGASPPPNFQIIHLNVRSLPGHLDEVTEFANSSCPDILALSETWLDSGVEDSLVSIPGFTIHRTDHNRHRGGVAVYVSDSLMAKRVRVGKYSDSSLVEAVWMKVSAPSIPSTTLVGCIYCPPNSSVGSINAVCDLLDQALSMRDLVVACGDLNVNLMDPEGHHSALLSDYITSRALFQPINMPTRIPHSSATLLDIFLITSKVTVKSAHVRDVGIRK